MKYKVMDESSSGFGSDILNIYSKSLELIKKGNVYGEISHPDTFDVSFNKASHIIDDVSLQYNNGTNSLYVDISVLNTEYGKVLKDMLEVGMPLNLTARASGFKNSDGSITVDNVYTYDFDIDTNGGKDYLNRKILAKQRKKKIELILGSNGKEDK